MKEEEAESSRVGEDIRCTGGSMFFLPTLEDTTLSETDNATQVQKESLVGQVITQIMRNQAIRDEREEYLFGFRKIFKNGNRIPWFLLSEAVLTMERDSADINFHKQYFSLDVQLC